jgi:hypothetical protein
MNHQFVYNAIHKQKASLNEAEESAEGIALCRGLECPEISL